MRHALPLVALVAALMTFGGCDGDECVDTDEDGFGVGPGCKAADCDDGDALHHADCSSCSDPDRDGYGVGCDLGFDCDPSDGRHWADCGKCMDGDLDGAGPGCDLGVDCDDNDPDQFSGSCAGCTDADNDGNYVGCDRYINRPGPDCDDADGDNYLRCGYCADGDGDGHFVGCDRYEAHEGPDCDDFDNNNWASCGICRDADGDGYSIGCDQYAGALKGPDCNDGSGLHWTDCGQCTDSDGDGRGAGCNLGVDCSDSNRDAWGTCGTCADNDTDGFWAACDQYSIHSGPDCNDSDANAYSKCATCKDTDSDGYWAGCDVYTSAKPGQDCNDVNNNVWYSCGTCRDNDSDTYYVGCDAYTSVTGPDCGDADRNNWNQCSTCLDTDGDGRFAGCDAYTTINGPDCAPGDSKHWSDCGACVDNDGDGRGASCDLGTDCNDASANHWADCTTCTDVDGDGYGLGTCDLVGVDCADNNAARNPGAADSTRDGVDQNCDGYDGTALFTDNFDDGVFSPQWTTVSGDTAIQSSYRVSLPYALNLGYSTGNAQSLVFDTSVCSAIYWRYEGKRGPDSPESSDNLRLEYYNGTSYVLADQWFGQNFSDTSFSTRSGYISAADARTASFRLRFATLNGSFASDDFFIDDVVVACAPDADGDHFADAVDCAPTNSAHWNDCGVCVDNDTDNYGTGCNLGTDCLDTDATYNPAAADTVGDGFDQNCDGVDGTLVTNTFSATPNVFITDGGGNGGCAATGSVSSTITVTTPAATIQDVDVTVNITHSYDGDVDIFLQYSDGTNPPTCIELSTDNGFSSNYTNTVLSDEAATFITSASSPFTGTFRPESPLSALDGKPMVGTYTLYVNDDAAGFSGTLTSWSVAIKHL